MDSIVSHLIGQLSHLVVLDAFVLVGASALLLGVVYLFNYILGR